MRTGMIHCCLYLCSVNGGYLPVLLGSTYLDFLHKVDTLASFIGQIDLLASCAVYADMSCMWLISATCV